MPSDPYAQYLTPPAATAPSGAGNDPYAQYLTPPGASKAASAQPSTAYQPTWLDKVTNVANPTLGLSDIVGAGLGSAVEALGGPHTPTVAEARAQRAQQADELGPVTSTIVRMAGYMPMGAVLGPTGATAGLAGRPIAQGAAEGALAGGISNFDPNDPIYSTGIGAGMGALWGGAGGAASKGVGKALSTPRMVDPAAEIARTQQIKTNAYGALHQVPGDPGQVDQAIGGVMSNLDPSVETGMSSGLGRQINDIRSTLQQQMAQGKQINMGQVDSWQRQVNAAAQRERYPTDSIVAKQINDSLDGLIQRSGAGDLQDAAQAANQNYVIAQKMADWQQRIKAGGSVGQAPLTEAESSFLQNDPDRQAALTGLYQQSQNPMSKLSYGLGHLGTTIAGFGGHAVGGFPGAVLGEGAWLLQGKPMLQRALKGYDKNQLLKAYQAAYPQLTGGQPIGGTQANPAVGEAIKNLMLGGVY